MIPYNMIVMLCWYISNFIAVAFMEFTDIIVLRMIGWIWVSISISTGGLIAIGSLFGTRSKSE